MASILAQLVVDGLGMGLVYVLLASGFNLIIAITGILFIAYGEFYMLGAFTLWGLMVPFKLPFSISLIGATVVPAIAGGVVYRLVFRRIQNSSGRLLNSIVAAMGLMIVIRQGAFIGFGPEARGIPSSPFPGMIELGSVSITMERLVLIVLSLALLIALQLFLQKTNVGRAMRAVSLNADVAGLQGVNPDRTYLMAVIIGSALAGFAGGMMAPVFALEPGMGGVTFLVLLVVMLGGIGSMLGAVLAGLILGLTLSFGQFFIGSGPVQILFFALIGVITYFRPGGLLGEANE
jgi:branched-chain amino acid transport system permease protein